MTRRHRAAEVATPGTTVDVGDATTRCLLYGLLPSRFVPGLADRVMHRRTRIEDTAGTRESLIHSLMTAEVGIPTALTLRYEVNPLLLTVQCAGAAVHEATALWDVRTAVRSEREVKPVEQHIHSLLESLPFGAAIGACVLLPYGEEPLRCRRAARARKNELRAGGEAARRHATKGR
ncbi:diguanylate cyclase [Streptomyces sp. NPDC000345]|uniref:diguanylate cyclase n=1 Tax=Streptomyces sp. NPDC000345 TaxID=3364537 RepID=UPI00369E9C10